VANLLRKSPRKQRPNGVAHPTPKGKQNSQLEDLQRGMPATGIDNLRKESEEGAINMGTNFGTILVAAATTTATAAPAARKTAGRGRTGAVTSRGED